VNTVATGPPALGDYFDPMMDESSYVGLDLNDLNVFNGGYSHR